MSGSSGSGGSGSSDKPIFDVGDAAGFDDPSPESSERHTEFALGLEQARDVQTGLRRSPSDSLLNKALKAGRSGSEGAPRPADASLPTSSPPPSPPIPPGPPAAPVDVPSSPVVPVAPVAASGPPAASASMPLNPDAFSPIAPQGVERLIDEVMDEVEALPPAPSRPPRVATPPPTPATIPAAPALRDELLAGADYDDGFGVDALGDLEPSSVRPSFSAQRGGSRVPPAGPSFAAQRAASAKPSPGPSFAAKRAASAKPSPGPSFAAKRAASSSSASPGSPSFAARRAPEPASRGVPPVSDPGDVGEAGSPAGRASFGAKRSDSFEVPLPNSVSAPQPAAGDPLIDALLVAEPSWDPPTPDEAQLAASREPPPRPLFPRANESRTDVVDSEAAAIDRAVLRSVETGVRSNPVEPGAQPLVSMPAFRPSTGFGAPDADAERHMKVVVGRPDAAPQAESNLELAYEPRARPQRAARRDVLDRVSPTLSITRPVLIFAAVAVASLVALWVARSCGG